MFLCLLSKFLDLPPPNSYVSIWIFCGLNGQFIRLLIWVFLFFAQNLTQGGESQPQYFADNAIVLLIFASIVVCIFFTQIPSARFIHNVSIFFPWNFITFHYFSIKFHNVTLYQGPSQWRWSSSGPPRSRRPRRDTTSARAPTYTRAVINSTNMSFQNFFIKFHHLSRFFR